MAKILYVADGIVQYRLKFAGAVLVAKLVSGSLAYDDIWFGGRTRNPWNIEEFSTGSSAGPAASTSGGTVQRFHYVLLMPALLFVCFFLPSFFLIHVCSYWIILKGHYIVIQTGFYVQ